MDVKAKPRKPRAPRRSYGKGSHRTWNPYDIVPGAVITAPEDGPADYDAERDGPMADWLDAQKAPGRKPPTRKTVFTDAPGGGVCRCLNDDSPIVCDDCPVLQAQAPARKAGR